MTPTLARARRARLLPAATLAALLGLPLLSRAEGSGASETPAAAHLPLQVVRGSIARVTPGALTVNTPEGVIPLALDRNTTVYLEERVGTLQDLRPGTLVRADVGRDHRASWIEVEPRLPSPSARHVSGGPIVLPAPAPSTPAAAASASEGQGDGSGSGDIDVPAGPGAPEPNPGAGRTAPAAPPTTSAPTGSERTGG